MIICTFVNTLLETIEFAVFVDMLDTVHSICLSVVANLLYKVNHQNKSGFAR